MFRRTAPVLVALALTAAPAMAQDKTADPPPKTAATPLVPPPKPMTEDEAVGAVLEAFKARDEARLKDLGAKDDPDPWIVADELCAAGEHEAALMFAKAALRKDTEALPGFVEVKRGKGDDSRAREALRAVNFALKARDSAGALAASEQVVLGEGTSPVMAVRILHSRGLALRGQRKLPESAAAFDEAAKTASGVGWLRRAASSLYESGVCAVSRSDWNAALDAWSRSLAIEEEREDRARAAMTIGNIGMVHLELQDYPKALSWLERALELNEALGNRKWAATNLGNIGLIHRSRGDYPKALSYQERALRICEEIGDRAGVARALGNLGNIHKRLGDYPKALSTLESALRANEELGDRGGTAANLGNIGIAFQELGDLPRALSYQERALRMCEELGDRAGVAATLGNVGLVHESLGDYPKALAYHERALELKEAIRDREGMAATLGNIGNIHGYLWNHRRALAYQERSLKLREEIGDRNGMAKTLGNIGIIHHALGDYPNALSCQERSLQIKETLGDRAGVAATLGNIGGIHHSLRDYGKAISLMERSLQIKETLGDLAGVATTLGNIGLIHESLGDYPKALSYEERALKMKEDLGDRAGVATTLGNIGHLHHLLGEHDRALVRAKQSVEGIPWLTRGVSEEQQALGRQAYDKAFIAGALAAASLRSAPDLWYFLESGRAGALRDSLKAREALQGSVVPKALGEAERAARGRETASAAAVRRAAHAGDAEVLKSAQSAHKAAQDEVAEIVGRIQREAKAAATVMYGAVDDLRAFQSRVGPGEAGVFYGVFAGEESIALVVTAKEARIVPLGKTAAVEGAVSSLRLEDRAADLVAATEALRTLVVAPLSLGEEVRRVLVSPDGALSYMPFAYLMPGKELVYIPSGTVHGLLLEERAKRGDGVLALGDPIYGEERPRALVASLRSGWDLGSLPATREEAKAIGGVTLLGAEATEQELKAALARKPRWRAVHLACHGLLDAERPMFSSLAMTPAGEDDGFLTVLEVFRMKCPADLVVLSACETGKGTVNRAEGIVGPTRAFMFAGAPRVIVSLWKVDDEATKALMVKFYELWNPKDGSKGVGAAAALKRAQEFVAGHEKWKHPSYWAAWVLWGLPE